jgi:hypothetical protein
MMNILEALDSPEVFAPLFRKPETWKAWRSFLAALFALPMTDDELAIYRECTGRAEPPTTATEEAWLVCGRRSGKSYTLALIAVFLSCFRDWRPFLGPGECATVMIIAADRRQARTIVRYVKGLLKSVPMLAATIESETQESITLTNRVVIETHTASFRAVRGYTVVAALADEIAFWTTDEAGANPDHEVLNAIRPAMATVPGAMLLCASSPYSRRGALWEAYHRHFGQAGGPLIWQAPTRVMNPLVTQAYVDGEYEKDPISAAAEFGAQFRTDIEGFVSREAIEAVTDWGVLERGPIDGARYAAFTDPSGGSGDSFALAISHKEGETGILDCTREVRPPFSPEGVVQEFSDLLKTYRITKVRGDRYAGEFPRELFRKQGINYELSDDPKSAIYVNFLPLINSGRVRLLGNQRLVGQFLNLERTTSRAGRDSIDHAPGGHDDVANAVAGALLAATAKKPTMQIGYGGPWGDGRIHWQDTDEPREHSRVRIVHMSEKEWIEAKEKEHLR